MAKNTVYFISQYFRHGHRPGLGADRQPERGQGGARLPGALPLHHTRPLRDAGHCDADQDGARAVSHQAGAKAAADPRHWSLRPQAAQHHRDLQLRRPGGHEDPELLHSEAAGAQAASQHHGEAGDRGRGAEMEAGSE